MLPRTKLLHGLAHQRTVREWGTTGKQPRGQVLRKTIVKLRLVPAHRRTVRRNRKTVGQERETTAKQPRGPAHRKTIVKLRLVQGHRRTIGPEQKTIVRKIIAT